MQREDYKITCQEMHVSLQKEWKDDMKRFLRCSRLVREIRRNGVEKEEGDVIVYKGWGKTQKRIRRSTQTWNCCSTSLFWYSCRSDRIKKIP